MRPRPRGSPAWPSATGSRRPKPRIWRRATLRRTSISTACPSARAAASSPVTTFPADGEYKFSIQNFGIGSFIPGEQLALIIDGERAHVWPYRGVGVAVGMTADSDGTLEVSVPVRAGSRMVGATFIATNYRPSLDSSGITTASRSRTTRSRRCRTTRRSGSFAFRVRSTRSVRQTPRAGARSSRAGLRRKSTTPRARSRSSRRWRAAPTAARRRRRRSRRR